MFYVIRRYVYNMGASVVLWCIFSLWVFTTFTRLHAEQILSFPIGVIIADHLPRLSEKMTYKKSFFISIAFFIFSALL